MKSYVTILDDFVDQLYVDEELNRDEYSVGTCQKDSECDRQRECMYRGTENTSGKCMGWSEKNQKTIFMTSLRENEKGGKNCDSDNS